MQSMQQLVDKIEQLQARPAETTPWKQNEAQSKKRHVESVAREATGP